MLFVTLCNLRPGSPAMEGARRRADWTPPEGMKIVAEYWLTTNRPAVIVIVETNDAKTFFESRAQWSDIFDMESFGAVTGEEGAALAREMFAGSRAAMAAASA